MTPCRKENTIRVIARNLLNENRGRNIFFLFLFDVWPGGWTRSAFSQLWLLIWNTKHRFLRNFSWQFYLDSQCLSENCWLLKWLKEIFSLISLSTRFLNPGIEEKTHLQHLNYTLHTHLIHTIYTLFNSFFAYISCVVPQICKISKSIV